MTKTLPREGWWFSNATGVLPHGDGRPIVLGEKLSVKGKLVLCRNALHGSFDPFDALQYAPGSVLHRVLFSGPRIEDGDKVGSRSRTVLASRDATATLRLYARRQALSVIHLWDPPAVVREYLETGDETKREASAWAPWDTAREASAWAARDARASAEAEAAAQAARETSAAAWASALAAQEAAAEAAQEAAAVEATAAEARGAALAAARAMFNEMVAELFSETSNLGDIR
jgi:hypothetical protein